MNRVRRTLCTEINSTGDTCIWKSHYNGCMESNASFITFWMHLIRMPSKWIAADCLVWIINLIRWNLRGLKNLYDIVLSLNVLTQRYCDKVVNAARANGIRLHFIPGSHVATATIGHTWLCII